MNNLKIVALGFAGVALAMYLISFIPQTTPIVGRINNPNPQPPTSATDNAIVRYDGTSGRITQNSGMLIDDSDNLSGVTLLTVDGAVATSTFASGLTVDTLTLVIDFEGGRIGVATSSPGTLMGFYSAATTTVTIDSEDNAGTGKGGCIKFKDLDGGGYSFLSMFRRFGRR